MLLIGDCFKKIDEIEEKHVQAIVTSPPYWGLRDYKVGGQIGEELTPEEFVLKLTALFRKCKRVLKDDGILAIAIPTATENSNLSNLGILKFTWSSEHYSQKNIVNEKKEILTFSCHFP